ARAVSAGLDLAERGDAACVDPDHAVEDRAEGVEVDDLGGRQRELIEHVAAALAAAVGAARPVVVVRGGEIDGERAAGGHVDRAGRAVVGRARRVRTVAVLVDAVAAVLRGRVAGGRAAHDAGARRIALLLPRARALAEPDRA